MKGNRQVGDCFALPELPALLFLFLCLQYLTHMQYKEKSRRNSVVISREFFLFFASILE